MFTKAKKSFCLINAFFQGCKMKKLNEDLLYEWQNKTFQPSTLIHSQNLSEDINYLYEFIRSIDDTFKTISLENNPDAYLINNDAKNPVISIEQIRDLKKWYYTTACFSAYKFAIIIKPENMTNNAANACLKFLEDGQKNKFTIFLSENPYAIIKTLLSRCKIINSYTPFTDTALMEIYRELINAIYNQNIDLLSTKFLQNSPSDLAKCILIFFNRIVKYQLKILENLEDHELKTAKKLLDSSIVANIAKFKKVFNIISNNQSFDEKLLSCLLIEEIMG